MSQSIVEILQSYKIDLTQETLWWAVFHIAFNPTYWNCVARAEYNGQALSRIAGGNKKLGCYMLALSIFVLGLTRDHLYHEALKDQEVCEYLDNQNVRYLAIAIFGYGNVLVLTSMWALGITGTYLGDYFGILMDHRVTSFPFNISDNPMYHGSALCFLGTALYYAKPAGLFVTAIVWTCYSIALRFEEPFTAQIYAKRDAELKEKAK